MGILKALHVGIIRYHAPCIIERQDIVRRADQSSPRKFSLEDQYRDTVFHRFMYAHVSCYFTVLYIRSLCLGAARIMLSTRKRSSAASDAELTTARLSL